MESCPRQCTVCPDAIRAQYCSHFAAFTDTCLSSQIPGTSFVIPKVINLCSQAILTKLHNFLCRKMINNIILSNKGWKTRSVTLHDMEIGGCSGETSHRWGRGHTCFSSSLVKKTFFYDTAQKGKMKHFKVLRNVLSNQNCHFFWELPKITSFTDWDEKVEFFIWYLLTFWSPCCSYSQFLFIHLHTRNITSLRKMTKGQKIKILAFRSKKRGFFEQFGRGDRSKKIVSRIKVQWNNQKKKREGGWRYRANFFHAFNLRYFYIDFTSPPGICIRKFAHREWKLLRLWPYPRNTFSLWHLIV